MSRTAAAILRQIESLGFATSTHRMGEYVEMHAVRLSDPEQFHLARVDGDGEDAVDRCAAALAQSIGIELEGRVNGARSDDAGMKIYFVTTGLAESYVRDNGFVDDEHRIGHARDGKVTYAKGVQFSPTDEAMHWEEYRKLNEGIGVIEIDVPENVLEFYQATFVYGGEVFLQGWIIPAEVAKQYLWKT